jgi:hypothetical protein
LPPKSSFLAYQRSITCLSTFPPASQLSLPLS